MTHVCSLWQHQQHKYANLTSESWYVNEINKLQEKKWYLKLTWAKTDDILDSIPFKVVENCSIKSARYAVLFELAWSEHKLGAEEVIMEIFVDQSSHFFFFDRNESVDFFKCFRLNFLLLSLFRKPFQCDV